MTVDLPLPGMRPTSTVVPEVWRLLPGTATARWDCTPHGIASRCHGHCCTHGFWPPKPDGRCVHLGAEGCTIGDARPIACHLYPLQLREDGTLVAHAMTRWPKAMCQGNRNAEGAPWLIDALRPGLVAVFGVDAWHEAHRAAEVGRPHYFHPAGWVLAAWRQELVWKAAGVPPEARH